MIEIRQTKTYIYWFESLRDRQAKARIDQGKRILKMGGSRGITQELSYVPAD